MAAHKSKREEPVEISGEFVHETERALLLRLDDTGEEKWFPLSVIVAREHSGTDVTIEVAQWFAEKEGLI